MTHSAEKDVPRAGARLAIADPPYPPHVAERRDVPGGPVRILTRSRARRWYGDGTRPRDEQPADFHPAATEWAIILSDWKRCDAWVTVHLRGGVSLGPGRVTRIPGNGLDGAEIRDPQRVTRDGRRETKWTFDLNDVAAITAEAAR